VSDEIAVLSSVTNSVVVHVRGRRYPGLVVQGDRLKSWLRLADEDDAESKAILADELRRAVAWYDEVSHAHGVGMDY
jgi:hypothetical protein